ALRVHARLHRHPATGSRGAERRPGENGRSREAPGHGDFLTASGNQPEHDTLRTEVRADQASRTNPSRGRLRSGRIWDMTAPTMSTPCTQQDTPVVPDPRVRYINAPASGRTYLIPLPPKPKPSTQ